MKAATVNELKKELSHASAKELIEYCSRLARFKKENKELLTYLLFESHDEPGYIKQVKDDMESQFDEIERDKNLYFTKKTLRKILRTANKHIRYIGTNNAEIELLLFYCTLLKESGIPFHKSAVILNVYNTQLKKIKKTVAALHEDLQYDYNRQLKELS